MHGMQADVKSYSILGHSFTHSMLHHCTDHSERYANCLLTNDGIRETVGTELLDVIPNAVMNELLHQTAFYAFFTRCVWYCVKTVNTVLRVRIHRLNHSDDDDNARLVQDTCTCKNYRRYVKNKKLSYR